MNQANYQLLDFGDGRKLEQFGQIMLDRPAPAAEADKKSQPHLWCTAAARFDGRRAGDGAWTPDPSRWTPPDWEYSPGTSANPFRLLLDALPAGQVGVFPEQRDNWHWIANQIARCQSTRDRPLRVLNLFAYTGGSTLAAAAAGAEVVHVDAARNIVERARKNAEHSALGAAPIRWIAEDTMKFCRRELKRGNKYDAVILDPPTYGHGPKGEPWKIGEHLLPLLELCGQLTADERTFILVTCHSPGIGPAELSAYLCEGIFGNCSQPPAAGELFLQTSDGRRLPSGVYARWPR